MDIKKSLRTAFSIAALALGGAGMTCSGAGLATGGWTAGEWDFRPLGAALTVLSAGLFYAGYRGVRNGGNNNENAGNENPPLRKPEDPKP